MQAVESLQELSNVSSENLRSHSSRPPILNLTKHSLLSSASQTLSPRTPSQSHSSDNKRCVNCQCTSTPLWRKDKSSGLMYCNACGIYLKNHGKHRPVELIEGIGMAKIVSTAGAHASACHTPHSKHSVGRNMHVKTISRLSAQTSLFA